MSLSQPVWHNLETQEALQIVYQHTPVGLLAIHMRGKLLCKLEWLLTPPADTEHVELPTALEQQFKQYWHTGKFTMPTALLQQGTEFQQKIWHALYQIPLGQTKTYGELANELDTGSRALANACRKNPFPLIIPCHRVQAKTGIGGYAGASSGKLIKIKAALLKHEKKMAYGL
jgi:methylated-DNA-[protein]-cysteine S-methyltransferase